MTTTCDKIAYAAKADAKKAKRSCQQMAAGGVLCRQEQRVYRCHRCRCWHLTSAPHRYWDEVVA